MEEFTPKICAIICLPYDQQYEILLLMERFHKTAKKEGLVYWASGGTLLGLVIYNTILPWDDDLDITIPFDNKEKAKTVINDLCKNYSEYSWKEHNWGKGFRGFKITKKTIDWSFDLDIFIFYKITIEGIDYFSIPNNPKPIDNFKISDLFDATGNLLECNFGIGSIYAPVNSTEHLRIKYPKWQSQVPIYNHSQFQKKRLCYSLGYSSIEQIKKYIKGGIFSYHE